MKHLLRILVLTMLAVALNGVAKHEFAGSAQNGASAMASLSATGESDTVPTIKDMDLCPIGSGYFSAARNLPQAYRTRTLTGLHSACHALKNSFVKGGETVNPSKPLDFIINSGHFPSGIHSRSAHFIVLRKFRPDMAHSLHGT